MNIYDINLLYFYDEVTNAFLFKYKAMVQLFFYLLISVHILYLYSTMILSIQMKMHRLQLTLYDRKIIIYLFVLVLYAHLFYLHVIVHLCIYRNNVLLLCCYLLADSYL